MERSAALLCILLLGAALAGGAAPPAAATPAADLTRWRATAARVTIARDEWGIAHVSGKSDADAVFGAIYAQAEDDWSRVEANYLTALGRTAEVDGEKAIWQDLRQRLWVDPADLQARYRSSAPWLRALMDSWADGLNFYLATHPATKPRLLTRFEPWMALSFTEGSIGGDIERVDLEELAKLYGGKSGPKVALADPHAGPPEPRGSNGIALAPKLTRDGHALLLINPHTSFYFRSELQISSDEGLNAYGASTWGQFFIYQGFNGDAGWMHTSSGVDSVDEFAETTVPRAGGLAYRYGSALRPVTVRTITLRYRTAGGATATRTFRTLATHHGPIVARRRGKLIAEALMWKPVPALEQSWLRTKAKDLDSYLEVARRQANSSNDTIFADAKGEIAYLHPQFVPVRDNRYDFQATVDGSRPITDWKGLTPLASLPNVLRPASGYVFNTNNWPWTAAGPDSPRAGDYPHYMDSVGENPRGLHAGALLARARNMTPEALTALAFDPYLPAFAQLLPSLFAAWEALPAKDPQRLRLAAPIAMLRGWDRRWSATSEPTSLAVFWGDALAHVADPFAKAERRNITDYIATQVTPQAKLNGLDSAVDRLTRDFGRWRVPWGEINRFQRLDDRIDPHFDDSAPSTPVPFVSAQWGSLASFGAHAYPNAKRYYGTSGNSFVAVVEFGPQVRAWAVMAGGQSGDPKSPHFADQIDRYAAGNLRPIHFTPDDVAAHAARRYHPGEATPADSATLK